MIHSIVGLQSSGKSLYMAKLGLDDYLKGRDIITNMNLSYPHAKINRDFIIHIVKEQPNLENTTFLLDEFWLWIDSRKSFENTIVSYFGLQTSKEDINLLMTAQDNSQNDVRFRRNMHRVTNCHRVLKVKRKFIDVPSPYDEMRKLPSWLNHILYIKTIQFKKINVGLYSDLAPERIQFHKANNYFKLFDTRQKQKLDL